MFIHTNPKTTTKKHTLIHTQTFTKTSYPKLPGAAPPGGPTHDSQSKVQSPTVRITAPQRDTDSESQLQRDIQTLRQKDYMVALET